eukprot:TRINITY_DN1079_c0_g1_i1.p1 TRINITY_DN1079_c0_g1~~TRINITY_DN1079_c0_g1_i1.p1  ORF type:complete len:770 (+),score=202.46 TRINITY_DN1079_c0_g1_i1:127-2436(+)
MQGAKIYCSGRFHVLACASNGGSHRNTGRKKTKEERRTLIKSFVDKYKISNGGQFPSITLTRKNVGGSYYLVREIMRELKEQHSSQSFTADLDAIDGKTENSDNPSLFALGEEISFQTNDSESQTKRESDSTQNIQEECNGKVQASTHSSSDAFLPDSNPVTSILSATQNNNLSTDNSEDVLPNTMSQEWAQELNAQDSSDCLAAEGSSANLNTTTAGDNCQTILPAEEASSSAFHSANQTRGGFHNVEKNEGQVYLQGTLFTEKGSFPKFHSNSQSIEEIGNKTENESCKLQSLSSAESLFPFSLPQTSAAEENQNADTSNEENKATSTAIVNQEKTEYDHFTDNSVPTDQNPVDQGIQLKGSHIPVTEDTSQISHYSKREAKYIIENRLHAPPNDLLGVNYSQEDTSGNSSNICDVEKNRGRNKNDAAEVLISNGNQGLESDGLAEDLHIHGSDIGYRSEVFHHEELSQKEVEASRQQEVVFTEVNAKSSANIPTIQTIVATGSQSYSNSCPVFPAKESSMKPLETSVSNHFDIESAPIAKESEFHGNAKENTDSRICYEGHEHHSEVSQGGNYISSSHSVTSTLNLPEEQVDTSQHNEGSSVPLESESDAMAKVSPVTDKMTLSVPETQNSKERIAMQDHTEEQTVPFNKEDIQNVAKVNAEQCHKKNSTDMLVEKSSELSPADISMDQATETDSVSANALPEEGKKKAIEFEKQTVQSDVTGDNAPNVHKILVNKESKHLKKQQGSIVESFLKLIANGISFLFKN